MRTNPNIFSAIISIFLLIVFLAACSKDDIWKDDELSIKKADYTGNQIKIDGYYYYEYKDALDYIDVYFLYKNGIILYGSTFKKSELSTKEAEYQTAEWQSVVKESKSRWGVFKIEGNTIQFERWYPSDPPLKAYIRSGIILNDTTFQINKSVRSNGKGEREENEIYRFKEFSPKPDSTNNFIP